MRNKKGRRNAARQVENYSWEEFRKIQAAERDGEPSLNWDEVNNWVTRRDEDVQSKIRGKDELRAKTLGQERYLEAMRTAVVTLCSGPAGTGKSFLSTSYALASLLDGSFKKLILTRPAVTSSGGGAGLGFLPGSLNEKIAPYMRPVLDVLNDRLDCRSVERLMENGSIEVIPLDFMRGMSLKDTVVVADEMQNAAASQFHMLLTRFGPNCKVIVSGDASQADLPFPVNPLLDALRRLKGNPNVARIFLDHSDVVRHPLVQWIDEQYVGRAVVSEADC